jgi:PEP-CTERM motif
MKICIPVGRAGAVCAALALVGVLFISPASAGQITGVASISGPGLGFVAVPAITTFNFDNDNQTGGGPDDNNIVVPLKRFDNSDYIDIEFTVAPTNGITEYKVFEFVDNNTGDNWINYNMQLGTGVGAAFVPSPSGDAIDFDHPSFDTPPSSAAFSSVAMGEDALSFSNGTHMAGAQPYQFRLDVGRFLSPDGSGTFTLRQTPIVPEPASFALAGLAIAALSLLRRR